MNLVIVESPAKAKTINKYLGRDFIVKSSVGHIRDLPKSSSGKKETKKVDTKSMTKEQKVEECLDVLKKALTSTDKEASSDDA